MTRRHDRQTLRMLVVLSVVTLVAVVRLATALAASLRVPAPADTQAPAQTQEDTTSESADAAESATESQDPEREAFVAEWSARIDAYNAGYPLEGYGYAFAEAAYDCNVDPRLAPAIARLESGSGQVCFQPYNAWGWGSAAWSDWDTAIREYIAGFAASYGYTLTYESAQIYAPEEYDEWYPLLEDCMAQI